MKLTINRDALKYALGLANGYVDRTASQNNSKSPNGYVCIDATDGGAIFRATNGIIGINYKVSDCEVAEVGKCFIDGRRLLDFVGTLNEGAVTITRENDNITIKQSRARSKFQNVAVDDFREFPPLEEPHAFNIAAQNLAFGLKRISGAIAVDSSSFTGAKGGLVDIFENEIKFVGTDTKRIFINSIGGNFGDRAQIIIPKEAISEMQKIFFGEVQIQYNDRALKATGSDFVFYTKLINARFPDYSRLEKPTEVDEEFTLDRAEFSDALKKVAVFAEQVEVIFDAEGISFKSRYSEFGEGEAEINCETGVTEPVKVVFNTKYVTDFLNTIVDEKFTLRLTKSGRPSRPALFEVPFFKMITVVYDD